MPMKKTVQTVSQVETAKMSELYESMEVTDRETERRVNTRLEPHRPMND